MIKSVWVKYGSVSLIGVKQINLTLFSNPSSFLNLPATTVPKLLAIKIISPYFLKSILDYFSFA